MSPVIIPPSDRFWETLLTKIEEGRVIPVIGSELVQTDSSSSAEVLEGVIAQRLADEAGISQLGLDGGLSLRDVVGRAHRADPQEDYHGAVHRILRSIGNLTPPASMRALARITDFKLYVTLTFDTLLNRALEEERGITDPARQHIGYAPSLRQVDLPLPIAQLDEPYVYALFGKACSAPEFVISDEDLIEWVTALQDPDNRPLNLFDALRTHHILFLGCALPDWLLRFFLRMTREGRVSATRPSETLIDSAIPDQSGLVAFLDHFSPKTTILDIDPVSFVQELEQRWQKRKHNSPPPSAQELPPDLKTGGVFLSYASNDIDAARQLHTCLSNRQIDTWFDTNRLRAGASYDQIIQRNIGRCGLMIILLSKTTQDRLQRWQTEENYAPEKKPYFLTEWELALARESLFEGSLAIWPITVDSPDPSSHVFPKGLRKRTWEPMPGEAQMDAFVSRAKQAVREYRKKGLALP
jgi:hypothetical protein